MANLKNTTINDTGYLRLPSGTTAQRPGTPAAGMMRHNTDLSEMECYTGVGWSKSIVDSGLILNLDASNTSSYPGTGTTWTDLSGSGNNFNVVAAAWNSSGYFSFDGTNGYAKTASQVDVPGISNLVTYCTVTRPLNSTSQWRTLTRSNVGDHHVIIQNGGWNIGMYDNDAAGFISSGVSQQSLPGYPSGFDFMTWRWTDEDNPTYDLNVNGSQFATITNSDARYNRGFGILGGYHNENFIDPSIGSQPWGDISVFLVYNRRLSDDEVIHNYNVFRQRFSI